MKTELERPSTWVCALGLGLSVPAIHALTALQAGAPVNWLAQVVLGVSVFGVTLAGAHGLGGLLAALGVGVTWSLNTYERWLDLRAPRLAETATGGGEDEPEPVDTHAEAEAWRVALERFFRAGDAAGSFSIRKLAGVVGSSTWTALTDFYCTAAGENILRRVPGDEGTQWGRGWQLDDVTRRLVAGTLPHPDGPAPEVQVYVTNTTQRNAPRQRKTAPVVVEGEPSRPVA